MTTQKEILTLGEYFVLRSAMLAVGAPADALEVIDSRNETTGEIEIPCREVGGYWIPNVNWFVNALQAARRWNEGWGDRARVAEYCGDRVKSILDGMCTTKRNLIDTCTLGW